MKRARHLRPIAFSLVIALLADPLLLPARLADAADGGSTALERVETGLLDRAKAWPSRKVLDIHGTWVRGLIDAYGDLPKQAQQAATTEANAARRWSEVTARLLPGAAPAAKVLLEQQQRLAGTLNRVLDQQTRVLAEITRGIQKASVPASSGAVLPVSEYASLGAAFEALDQIRAVETASRVPLARVRLALLEPGVLPSDTLTPIDRDDLERFTQAALQDGQSAAAAYRPLREIHKQALGRVGEYADEVQKGLAREIKVLGAVVPAVRDRATELEQSGSADDASQAPALRVAAEILDHKRERLEARFARAKDQVLLNQATYLYVPPVTSPSGKWRGLRERHRRIAAALVSDLQAVSGASGKLAAELRHFQAAESASAAAIEAALTGLEPEEAKSLGDLERSARARRDDRLASVAKIVGEVDGLVATIGSRGASEPSDVVASRDLSAAYAQLGLRYERLDDALEALATLDQGVALARQAIAAGRAATALSQNEQARSAAFADLLTWRGSWGLANERAQHSFGELRALALDLATAGKDEVAATIEKLPPLAESGSTEVGAAVARHLRIRLEEARTLTERVVGLAGRVSKADSSDTGAADPRPWYASYATEGAFPDQQLWPDRLRAVVSDHLPALKAGASKPFEEVRAALAVVRDTDLTSTFLFGSDSITVLVGSAKGGDAVVIRGLGKSGSGASVQSGVGAWGGPATAAGALAGWRRAPMRQTQNGPVRLVSAVSRDGVISDATPVPRAAAPVRVAATTAHAAAVPEVDWLADELRGLGQDAVSLVGEADPLAACAVMPIAVCGAKDVLDGVTDFVKRHGPGVVSAIGGAWDFAGDVGGNFLENNFGEPLKDLFGDGANWLDRIDGGVKLVEYGLGIGSCLAVVAAGAGAPLCVAFVVGVAIDEFQALEETRFERSWISQRQLDIEVAISDWVGVITGHKLDSIAAGLPLALEIIGDLTSAWDILESLKDTGVAVWGLLTSEQQENLDDLLDRLDDALSEAGQPTQGVEVEGVKVRSLPTSPITVTAPK